MKSPISVPLEKCWEVPRKHCQSIPVKKPRIVVKKVPVKHCEYKGHHDDHHGYGHDDHHGGGYGHHRRSDNENPKFTVPYDPYSSTLGKLMKDIPDFSRAKTPSYSKSNQRYIPSFPPAPVYPDSTRRYPSSYDKHEVVNRNQASSVPTYEEYEQISFDGTREFSPEEQYSPASTGLDLY